MGKYIGGTTNVHVYRATSHCHKLDRSIQTNEQFNKFLMPKTFSQAATDYIISFITRKLLTF